MPMVVPVMKPMVVPVMIANGDEADTVIPTLVKKRAMVLTWQVLTGRWTPWPCGLRSTRITNGCAELAGCLGWTPPKSTPSAPRVAQFGLNATLRSTLSSVSAAVDRHLKTPMCDLRASRLPTVVNNALGVRQRGC